MNPPEPLPVLKPHRRCGRLIVGYASTDKSSVDVPYVRLRGRWMQDAGFVIGRHLKVEVSEGRLTIEQVD